MFGFGVAGAGTVTTYGGADSIAENSVDFVRRMDAQRDALIAKITGRVRSAPCRRCLFPKPTSTMPRTPCCSRNPRP